MIIDNIKVNDLNINYENSELKDIINKNKHMIPNLNKQSISFDIKDSNEAFANAIRRTFNDEILVKCLDINVHNFTSTDKFILPDNIKERINLISLDQSIDKNSKFHINVINSSNDIINVYSNDIVNNNKTDKKIYFNTNIQLFSLKPNRFVNISDISINSDYGYNNSIYALGSFKYKAINTDFNIPSLNNTVTDFSIELINNSNIKITDMIETIYNTLYIRLKKIQSAIKDYTINSNSEDINKINNEIYIINNKMINDLNTIDISSDIIEDINDIYEIHINNEYHTIGNLISKYVFLQEPNIELINYKLVHPLTHKLIITIKHKEYKKIINDSIENIIMDLNTFKLSINNFIKKIKINI